MGNPVPFDRVAAGFDQLYSDKACRAEDRALLRLLRPVVEWSGQSVLDLGCGTGWFLDHGLSPEFYLGTDISAAMVERANGKHTDRLFVVADAASEWPSPSPGGVLRVRSLTEVQVEELRARFEARVPAPVTVVLPEDSQVTMFAGFTLVVSLWCSASYFSPEHAAAQAMRVLRPGGRVFLMPHAGGSLVEGEVRGDHYLPPACYDGTTGWRPWVSWEARRAFLRAGFDRVSVEGFRANWNLPRWLPQRAHDLSRRFERRVHADECAFLVVTATKPED